MLTVFSCVASRNKRAHWAFYYQPRPQVTGRPTPHNPAASTLYFNLTWRVGRPRGTRPARLCESQEQSTHSPPSLSGSVCRPSPRAVKPLGDKAGDSANRATRFQPKARPKAKPKARPSSPPRVSLTAAPLSLRRISVARWDFISILLTAKRVKSLFRRTGDGVFAHGRVFPRAILCSRAGEILSKRASTF